MASIFGNLPAVLIPIMIHLNSNQDKQVFGLTRSAFLYIVVLDVFLRGSASLYFSFIGIAIGKTLKVTHRDEAARIMTMGALFTRSLAPMVAGIVVSYFMSSPSIHMTFSSSSWGIWIVIGLLFGSAAAAMTAIVRETNYGKISSNEHRRYILKRIKQESSDIWEKYENTTKKMYQSWVNSIFLQQDLIIIKVVVPMRKKQLSKGALEHGKVAYLMHGRIIC